MENVPTHPSQLPASFLQRYGRIKNTSITDKMHGGWSLFSTRKGSLASHEHRQVAGSEDCALKMLAETKKGS